MKRDLLCIHSLKITVQVAHFQLSGCKRIIWVHTSLSSKSALLWRNESPFILCSLQFLLLGRGDQQPLAPLLCLRQRLAAAAPWVRTTPALLEVIGSSQFPEKIPCTKGCLQQQTHLCFTFTSSKNLEDFPYVST